MEDGTFEKVITVTVRVNPREEMFSVDTIEGESGCTSEYGPTPLWSDWENKLKEHIGNEIISWVKIMEEYKEEK